MAKQETPRQYEHWKNSSLKTQQGRVVDRPKNVCASTLVWMRCLEWFLPVDILQAVAAAIAKLQFFHMQASLELVLRPWRVGRYSGLKMDASGAQSARPSEVMDVSMVPVLRQQPATRPRPRCSSRIHCCECGGGLHGRIAPKS